MPLYTLPPTLTFLSPIQSLPNELLIKIFHSLRQEMNLGD